MMDVDEALRWAEEGGSYRCSTIDSDVFKVLAAEVRRLRGVNCNLEFDLAIAQGKSAPLKFNDSNRREGAGGE